MIRYLALALTALLLTACSGGSPSDLSDADGEEVEYRGEVLSCIHTGLSKSKTLDCDFTGFYLEHPELLEDPTEGEEPDVSWYSQDGMALACVRKGGGETARMACDWPRFYANNPEARP